MISKQTIDYQDGDTTLEGYYAYPKDKNGTIPAVIVIHDWSGKNPFACQKAEELAELGYLGFALDMYGKGVLGQSKEEKTQLIQPFLDDRSKLLKRIQAAINTVKQIDEVDNNKIAAIGFCFGGLCVLDLARGGADVKGVISFHGLLGAPENMEPTEITAKILALHGYDDPMATPDQVVSFGNEMTARKADWQMTMYGNTLHAFTNPEANDPDFGTVYDAKADARSWRAMQDFLQEVFA